MSKAKNPVDSAKLARDLPASRGATRMKPSGQLLESVEEEGSRNEIRVDPQPRGREPDEISPQVSTKRQDNGSDLHPGLTKVEPADTGFPVGRQAQHRNETASAEDDQPFRGFGYNNDTNRDGEKLRLPGRRCWLDVRNRWSLSGNAILTAGFATMAVFGMSEEAALCLRPWPHHCIAEQESVRSISGI